MTDTELLDYLSTRWDQKGMGHYLFGLKFENPTRNLTFREAIKARMDKDSKPFEKGKV